MASVTNKYPGYFQLFGQKRVSIVDKFGPTSYVNGTGEVLSATLFGFKNLEQIEGGLDSTGVYWAAVYKGAGPQTTFTLKWFTFIGMTEVANLTDLHLVVAQLKAQGY